MTDALGFRKKFGVIAPSTNTCVQPEFEAMRPRGVTNHFGRIHIPNDPIRDDADFNQLMDNIRAQMFRAVDEVMTCEPDYLIMGMSSETFWDGLEGSRKLQQRVEARAGVKVSMGSDAARAALQCCGAKRIGVGSHPICRSVTHRCAGSSAIAASRSCASRASNAQAPC